MPDTSPPPKKRGGRKPLPPIAPISPLTDHELQTLAAGDVEQIFRARASQYYEFHRRITQMSAREAARYSFGLQVIQRELDRGFKHAFPEKIQIDLHGEIRSMQDSDLIALVRRLGALPVDAEVESRPALKAGDGTDGSSS